MNEQTNEQTNEWVLKDRKLKKYIPLKDFMISGYFLITKRVLNTFCVLNSNYLRKSILWINSCLLNMRCWQDKLSFPRGMSNSWHMDYSCTINHLHSRILKHSTEHLALVFNKPKMLLELNHEYTVVGNRASGE